VSLDFVEALDAATTTKDSNPYLLFICQVNGFSLLFYYCIMVKLYLLLHTTSDVKLSVVKSCNIAK